jgi:hypothetical protein
MHKELRTVLEQDGTPELELVKENGVLVIYEADDMDRHIGLPVSVIPALIRSLEELK